MYSVRIFFFFFFQGEREMILLLEFRIGGG